MVLHLAHDLRGAPALIIGGGPVAMRKVDRFAGETECIILSPVFSRTDAPATYIRTAVTPESLEGWIARTAPAIVAAAGSGGQTGWTTFRSCKLLEKWTHICEKFRRNFFLHGDIRAFIVD